MGHLYRARDDPSVKAVGQDGDLLFDRSCTRDIALHEGDSDPELPELIAHLEPAPRASRSDRIWAFGQGGKLVGHRFGDQQLGTEQADLSHYEKRPIHDRRSVRQVSPEGDVLARRHEVARDAELIQSIGRIRDNPIVVVPYEKYGHCSPEDIPTPSDL